VVFYIKKIIIILLVFSLFLFFGCTISVNPQDLAPSKNYSVVTDNNTNFSSSDSNAPVSKLILDSIQVAKHNSSGDCWMIINNNVYDLSTYVAHPGGSGYLQYCGTQSTTQYDTKDGRGILHSSYANMLLANYLVGTVGQEIIIQNGASQSNINSNPTPSDTNKPIVDTNTAQNNSPTSVQVSLTLSEVAKHNSSGNCWMVINNNVYDLSVYVSHPGGSGYLSYCGTNSTSGYDTKGGRGSGHSSYADSLLANYLIGQLGQTVIVKDINNSINQNLPPYYGDEDEFEDDD